MVLTDTLKTWPHIRNTSYVMLFLVFFGVTLSILLKNTTTVSTQVSIWKIKDSNLDSWMHKELAALYSQVFSLLSWIWNNSTLQKVAWF